MAEVSDQELIALATMARDRAYAPYSKFKVGAALLCASGQVFIGCNIENSAYPVTICAERCAISAAIAAGEHDFICLAVIANSPRPVSPCGMCRQVLAELAPSARVVLVNLEGAIEQTTTRDLLPGAFTSDDLRRGD